VRPQDAKSATNPQFDRRVSPRLSFRTVVIVAAAVILLMLVIPTIGRGVGFDGVEMAIVALFGILVVLVTAGVSVTRRHGIAAGPSMGISKRDYLELHDSATGLYRGVYISALLKREINRVERYGNGLSVMVLRIENFSRVLHSMGAEGGNVLLRGLADLVQALIRGSDIVARQSENEFLLVLTDTDPTGARGLAQRFDEAFRRWVMRNGFSEFDLRLTVGIADYFDSRGEDLVTLARQRMVLAQDVEGKAS
jgi:diguanylate cyclase (GGDEF)-like protein